MSTHRNIDRICIVVLVLTLLLTAAFMNGEKLGIRVAADEDAESYSETVLFTANDQDGDWAENADTTNITLDGSGGEIDGSGAYFLDGNLVISGGGWYVLSGTLENGGIVVDADASSKVWILLNGVTVHCSDDACLRVDQADKVFLTLAEGTENTFASGASYSEEALSDNTGGAIFSHDDLTINGSGSLTVTAGYKHGIDGNDSLVIAGGNLTITAPQDGIHVNDSFRCMAASLTIDAGDDGIHSDDELYVESGTILISSCYEGLEACTIDIVGGDITIYPRDDGINASGGSGTTDFGAAGGTGGRGQFAPSADMVDDGGRTTPPDGTETTGSETGNENGGRSLPFGGEMQGQPAAEQEERSADAGGEETYIRISGGTVTILNETGRDADGLDSNGNIYIDGGEIRISLPGDGGNSAIDCGSESGGECIVTGGTILAFGGAGMAEGFSADCTQCAVLYQLDAGMEAGTAFRVLDANGEELLSCTPACSYSAVAFSAPELTVGETCTVVFGENSAEVTLESTAVSVGSAGSMGSMQPGGMGGGEAGPPAGQDGETGREHPARQDGGRGGQKEPFPDGLPQAGETETKSSGFTAPAEIDGTVWLLLGASVLALAAGIWFAKKKRRRS